MSQRISQTLALPMQTLHLTSRPYSSEHRGTGGPRPGSARGLSPGGRKEGRERERERKTFFDFENMQNHSLGSLARLLRVAQ